MSLPPGATVAIVGLCSDPRFSHCPAERVLQLRKALGVDYVVMLSKPGIVGLFAKHQYSTEPKSMAAALAVHRASFLDDVVTHVRMHNPSVVGIASHATCGGFPGKDDFQQQAAIEAAVEFERVLRGEYGVLIRVVPLFEERIDDERWQVHNLLLDGDGFQATQFGQFHEDAEFGLSQKVAVVGN